MSQSTKSNKKQQKSTTDASNFPSMPKYASPITSQSEYINFGGKIIKLKAQKSKKKTRTPKGTENDGYNGEEEEVPKLQRQLCGCEGRDHRFLLNCLHCGRIHCEVELVKDGGDTGEYLPCLFCGNTLVNEFENGGGGSGGSSSDAPRTDNVTSKLVEQRNRLLEFDGNASKNYVIDDQMDYYQSENNKWLSKEERQQRRKIEEKLREKRGKKSEVKMSIDFSGRVVLGSSAEEDKAEMDKLKQELQRGSAVDSPSSSSSSAESHAKDTMASSSLGYDSRNRVVNPSAVAPDQIVFKSKGKISDDRTRDSASKWSALAKARHVQHLFFEEDNNDDDDSSGADDSEQRPQEPTEQYDDSHIVYEEPISTDLEDNGMCLSMHQPYASLLIHGIKRHEGRVWPTDYRGRLWIASTQQETTQEEIDMLKDFYTEFSRGHLFPRDFPTGSILGCVDMVDCLSSSEYVATVPPEEQESKSDYVFMVKNPRRVFIPISILGRPKIYKLDKETHSQCLDGLRPIDPSRIVKPQRHQHKKKEQSQQQQQQGRGKGNDQRKKKSQK